MAAGEYARRDGEDWMAHIDRVTRVIDGGDMCVVIGPDKELIIWRQDDGRYLVLRKMPDKPFLVWVMEYREKYSAVSYARGYCSIMFTLM